MLWHSVKSVVDALLTISKNHVGGTIIVDVKSRSGEDTVLNELLVDADGDARVLNDDTIEEILDTKKPGHDGAIVIRLYKDGKMYPHIAASQCWFPVDNRRRDRKEGTRHGSANLLTEAPIFVSSEERGTISYAIDGQLQRDVSEYRLLSILLLIASQELQREVG